MGTTTLHRTANCWCGHAGDAHYRAQEVLACRVCARPEIDDTPMLMTERRRFDRYAIPQPIRTSVGSAPAYVVDASIAGLGVLQHAEAPKVGSTCRLMFHSEFGPITLDCEVARSSVKDGTFQTGLRIVAADAQSDARLRTLVMSLAVPSAKHTH
ncbi:MAG TPA: PilZ domain-containing protein [Thermoanaerobaculia bacterium]|nr:PilZ domain-containing protein [Thermoanaerobaculia bacterium]